MFGISKVGLQVLDIVLGLSTLHLVALGEVGWTVDAQHLTSQSSDGAVWHIPKCGRWPCLVACSEHERVVLGLTLRAVDTASPWGNVRWRF